MANAGELVEQMLFDLITTDETNLSSISGIDAALVRTCHRIYAEYAAGAVWRKHPSIFDI